MNHLCSVKRKKRMAKRKHIQANYRRQKRLEAIIRKAAPVRETAPGTSSNKMFIFKSELDYISRCILDYKNIETGGQLFGYWTESGIPVVVYAIGPGPGANHQATFFNQDVRYLLNVGNELKGRYGLHHIGEWHSHHQLGLARPSGHDTRTMITTIREKGLGRFILCIGNCDATSTTLNGFLCDENTCTENEWDIIFSESPMRKEIDRALNNILVHPSTQIPRHRDRRLNSDRGDVPVYANGYWLNDRSNRLTLNSIVGFIKEKNYGSEVRIQLNGKGEAVISIESGRHSETILFPIGFPDEPPIIRHYASGLLMGETTSSNWLHFPGDILSSFIRFYETA